ncbi:MAG: DMT family transporter [Heteroscytonema crispum UTEX LB 1556]
MQQIRILEHQSSKVFTLAFIALCIGLISIASAAILIKFCEHEISPYTTVFSRFWLASLILGVWQGLSAIYRQREVQESCQSSPYSGAVIVKLLLVGISLAIDLILWAWSITQTSIANATLLVNLAPIFTCLGGWLIWKRQLDRQFLVGIIIAIFGLVTLGFNDMQITPDKFKGDIAALLGAISFGVYLLLVEQLQTQLNSTKIMLWSSIISMLFTFPIVLIDGGSIFPNSWQGWLTIIAFAVICQLLGQGSLVYSLKHLSADFVALFLLLDPVLASVGAWVFFSEKLSLLNLIGFAIVLVGISLGLSSPSALDKTQTV